MLWSIFFFPLLLGLVGFLEPCSIGANSLFVAHAKNFTRTRRLFEIVVFILVRALVVSVLGITAALVGKRFFLFEASYFLILGGIYVLLGIIYILAKYREVSMPSLGVARFVKGKTVLLGMVFGLAIPACAIPLLFALIGQSLFLSSVVEGFLSLFFFGVGLSVPLLFILMSNKSAQLFVWLRNKTVKYRYVPGILLVLVGVATMFSSYWWLGA